MTKQDTIEKILFRRAIEHKLEGYTLETAKEIAEALETGTVTTREPVPFSNSCNRHSNCADADAKAREAQRKCTHDSEDVSADILEGSGKMWAVMWCRRCGAYRRSHEVCGSKLDWTTPRATWTGPGR